MPGHIQYVWVQCSAILKDGRTIIHVFKIMYIQYVCWTGSCMACKTWRYIRYKVYLTFIMSACQMIGPGSIMQMCLSVDAVQVLSPGVWAQGSKKLFYSVKGSYGSVQILQRKRNLGDCCWHLQSTTVLQRAKVQNINYIINLSRF